MIVHFSKSEEYVCINYNKERSMVTAHLLLFVGGGGGGGGEGRGGAGSGSWC